MVLSYAFCNVSVMPMRREAAHTSEQVNEVLFGERVEILEINSKDWARVRANWDHYEGWCRLGQITVIAYKEYRKAPKYLVTHNESKLIFPSGNQWLPAGADIFPLKKGRIGFYNMEAKFKGKKTMIKKLELSCDSLRTAGMSYLNAPYLWGGRTIAGIDCSGLTQMAFKLSGKAIARDASQQAQEGQPVDFLQHAQCGDLAFFDNKEGRIVHVGLLLDHHTILHATEVTGRVVVDKIDPEGIISTSFRKRTHRLRLIRRYF